MFKSLKKILKQIIPPPTATFQREINRIDDTICSQNNQLKELVLRLQYQLQDLNQGNQIVLKQQIAMLNEISLIQENKLNQISEENKRLSDALERNKDKINQTMRIAEEATWAAIFNNTIGQSNWLQNKTFSPGRWAVGYPALYVIYRVLNEISPKRILEIGLGQSTRMIGQYAAAHTGVKHLVVEHDPEWISFFSNDFSLSNQTKIVQLSRKMVKHKESDAVRVFSDFQETLQGEQFDFIFVDAPWSGDMEHYARIDTLGIMPSCLSKDFVILIDDTDRVAERNTVFEMENCLQENGILYKKGRYSGVKDCTVLASQSIGFVTSM